jgi:phosphoglycerate dehydrogenase-like enzyme
MIGGASLDVTEPVPLPASLRPYTHPRVRLSLHTSAIGPHNTVELAHKFVRNFRSFSAVTALKDRVDIRVGY